MSRADARLFSTLPAAALLAAILLGGGGLLQCTPMILISWVPILALALAALYAEDDLITSLVLASLTVLAVFKVLAKPGVVGVSDLVFPRDSEEALKALSYYLDVWNWHEEAGRPNLLYHMNAPLLLGYLLLSMLLGAEAASKVWLTTCLMLVPLLAYAAYRRFYPERGKAGALTFALIYAFSPWLFDRVLSGHVYLILGYSIMPLAIFSFAYAVKRLEEWDWADVLRRGYLIGGLLALTSLGFHFLLLTVWAVVLYSLNYLLLGPRGLGRLKRLTAFLASLALGLVISSSFWLIPYVAWMMGSKYTFTYAPSLQETVTYSVKAVPRNIFRLSGYYLAFFDDISARLFGECGLQHLWRLSGYALWLLASLSIAHWLLAGRGEVLDEVFFLELMLAGLVLGQGANLGRAYALLFNTVPFFEAFRDPNKFVSYAVLSYAFFVSRLMPILTSRPRSLGRMLAPLAMGVILLYNAAWFTGDFGGFLSTYRVPEYYKEALSALRSGYEVRALYVPPRFIKYTWEPSHYIFMFDPVMLYSPVPYVAEMFGGRTDEYVRYLCRELYSNSTAFAGELLATLNVKYVVVRFDVADTASLAYSARVDEVMRHQVDMKPVYSAGPVVVYENLHETRGVVWGESALLFGDRRSLLTLAHSTPFDLSRLVVVFASDLLQSERLSADILRYFDYIILDGSESRLDFALSLVERRWIMQPWRLTGKSSDYLRGWVASSYLWWADLHWVQAYPSPFVYTEREGAELVFKRSIEDEGSYEVWVKAYAGYLPWSSERRLAIRVDDMVCRVNVRRGRGFRWFKACEVNLTKGTHEIAIVNERGANAVAQLLVAPKHAVTTAFREAGRLLRSPDRPRLVLLLDPPLRDSLSVELEGRTGGLASGGEALALPANATLSIRGFLNGRFRLYLRVLSSTEPKLAVYLDGVLLNASSIARAARGAYDLVYRPADFTESSMLLIRNLGAAAALDFVVLIEGSSWRAKGMAVALKYSYDPLWAFKPDPSSGHSIAYSYCNVFLTDINATNISVSDFAYAPRTFKLWGMSVTLLYPAPLLARGALRTLRHQIAIMCSSLRRGHARRPPCSA